MSDPVSDQMGPVSDPVTARVGFDPVTARVGFTSGSRSARPDIGVDNCPFCPGGTECPDQFTTWAFPNRWPAIAPGRCEVMVHSPDHTLDFATMTRPQVRAVVDMWAERSQLMVRHTDVRCALVFENRGKDAGATVAHPHSQLFGLPLVPPLLGTERVASRENCAVCAPGPKPLLVRTDTHWITRIPQAPPAPYTLRLSPLRHVAGIDQLTDTERDGLADALGSAVRGLDAVFARPMPYQLWLHRTAEAGGHLTVTLAGLLRSPGRVRIPGAAELATGLAFTPVDPAVAAAALRD
ncbi:DUF4931 domain-containing protein [Streptomyces sp. NPDC057474]|uniref:galactose-1-phosphate uridylyltransferase n=1 Tax=Streptomyces sp. NPDC057474 TaxID=3346144 RepID=UPI00369CA1D5